MKKQLAVIMALILCLTAWPAGVFAEGDVPEGGEGVSLRDSGPAVTAVSPAFQMKDFRTLNAAGKLKVSKGMALSEEPGKNGLVLKGKAADINAGRITVAEDFDFGEKPESRKTDVGPVGRIVVDGLSDKGATVKMNIYLDNEEEPRASMLLRRQLGKIGWNRKGEKTLDVLSQKITGKHSVSIGFEISGVADDKKTTLLLRTLTFCENSLPVMYFNIDETEGSIDAMNTSEDHSAECYGTVTLQVPEGYKGEFSDKELSSTGPLELDYLRGRGNSTWYMDKKPYKVKLDKKQNLLGMGENKHWVLLANRYDNTLLRNRITYWIVRKMGMDYAIKCAPVEVVMNGEYYGSYLLSQQVRIGSTRIEIDELDEKVSDPESIEITGGYLLNMAGGDTEYGEITTPSTCLFGLESPDFSDYPDTDEAKKAKDAQYNYIKNFLTKVDNAVMSKDMKDDEGISFREYMDEQSAADFWWIQEFAINGDAYCNGSNYLYKKRDTVREGGKTNIGKLYWGPLWDFDYVAWGNPNDDSEIYFGFDNTQHLWMSKLRSLEDFQQRLKARWSAGEDKEHMNDAHLDDLISEVVKENGVLDQYYNEIRVSEYYDFCKYGFYNADSGEYSYAGTGISKKADEQGQNNEQGEDPAPEKNQTYESEIEQLRSWIKMRQGWVNENLADVGAKTFKVNFIADGKVLETRSYVNGEQYGELPEAPEKKGYTFIGWFDQNEEIVTPEVSIWDAGDVTAMYVKNGKVKEPENIYFKEYDVYTWYSNFDDEDFDYYPDYEFLPAASAEPKIEWSVSDPEIAEVSEEGAVHGKKPGTVKVTAKLPSGKKNSFKVTFVDPDGDMNEIEEVNLSKKKLSIKPGSYTQLRTVCSPRPHIRGEFDWLSMNPEIAEVDEFGIVQGRKPGKTTVVVFESNYRKYSICQVTVTMSKAYAKSVKVSGVKAKAAKKGSKRTVKVSWNKAAGVSGYYVLRASKKNGKYMKAGTVKKAGTIKWTDKNVKTGKKYFYKVQAYTKISGKTYKGRKSAAASVRVK